MKREMQPETRRAIFKWIVQAFLGWIGSGLLIFLVSGRLDWVWGRTFLGVIGALLAIWTMHNKPINASFLEFGSA